MLSKLRPPYREGASSAAGRLEACVRSPELRRWAARSPVGTCARPSGTPCIYKARLRPLSHALADPSQRGRLTIDNLTDRIAEAEKEGWLGPIEGRAISRAGATDKLCQRDRRSRSAQLGMPSLSRD